MIAVVVFFPREAAPVAWGLWEFGNNKATTSEYHHFSVQLCSLHQKSPKCCSVCCQLIRTFVIHLCIGVCIIYMLGFIFSSNKNYVCYRSILTSCRLDSSCTFFCLVSHWVILVMNIKCFPLAVSHIWWWRLWSLWWMIVACFSVYIHHFHLARSLSLLSRTLLLRRLWLYYWPQ